MARTAPTSLVLSVGLCLSAAHFCGSAEPEAKDAAAKKYRALVQQLVSPNVKPITTHDGDAAVRLPKGYDVAAQERIKAARQTLYDEVEEALPYLVEALDDKRYCMTIDWAEGDAYYNLSVGDICRHIIACQLEVYRDEIAFGDPQHWNRYNYKPLSREWWEARRDRNLADLQVEAIEWALEQRRAEPKETVGEGREDEIAQLQRLRDKIATSGKPAKGQKMLRMVTKDRRTNSPE